MKRHCDITDAADEEWSHFCSKELLSDGSGSSFLKSINDRKMCSLAVHLHLNRLVEPQHKHVYPARPTAPPPYLGGCRRLFLAPSTAPTRPPVGGRRFRRRGGAVNFVRPLATALSSTRGRRLFRSTVGNRAAEHGRGAAGFARPLASASPNTEGRCQFRPPAGNRAAEHGRDAVDVVRPDHPMAGAPPSRVGTTALSWAPSTVGGSDERRPIFRCPRAGEIIFVR